ncbi:MAG: TaqI-like C-terminal specificity domain-containing protein [Candidatus Bipolaricaulota bacterium]
MPTPREVRALVQRFSENRASYLSGPYNETQTRIEFVDPFFTALGWDVANVSGYAEAYKDVVHEDAIVIGGLTKAPDYSFRVGGARKFFVETKRPGVKIKDDAGPAFQLRRYAWSAKLPLSILTTFAELAVYDCRVKPERSDPASTARILFLTCDEYDARWDELAGILAKESVLKGSFDRYAESTKAKRGTAEVDDAFLAEIEGWREELARNLALRNPGLTQRELNFAVQRTIDRVIFLRICEDRGIEPYGGLQALLNGPNVYPRLGELFRRADERYNSGLFHFRPEKGRAEPPDELTLGLVVDDEVLKDILRRLYYPDSPYEFSVLPADILGQVYEQFLGKVIRLTAGHRAVVEAKPEVRKAGGVYYTPTYIVDYIVAHTVGVLLDGKTPHEVGGFTKAWKRSANLRPLRVLDPACGSGSFLLGAYQCLLDWYQKKYVEDGPEKHAKGRTPRLYRVGLPSPAAGRGVGGEGVWRLTTAERKRILLAHIYGVDIDPQAVEVTKLSLLLKVLEGETEETLDSFYRLFQERALPDLGANIKCGNSLIGPDFWEGKEYALLDEEERYRINPFDWRTEFPDVFSGDSPGFDAVIGNPPYGVPFSRPELSYFAARFPQVRKFTDSYLLFMIKGTEVIQLSGLLSMIVPNTFCDLENCEEFRRWLLTRKSLCHIWQTGWAFRAAIVDTLVFLVSKEPPCIGGAVQIRVGERQYQRNTAEFLENALSKVDYRNTRADRAIVSKLSRGTTPLGSLASVRAGVKIYEVGKGIPPQSKSTLKERPFSVRGVCPNGWRPLFRGDDVSRYRLAEPKEFVNYGPWLAAPREPELFMSPKILMRRTDDRLLACIEDDSAVCVNSCHVVKLIGEGGNRLAYLYLLGVLNSSLLQRVFEVQNPQMVGKVFAEVKVVYVERLPIRTIDFSNAADKARHEKMVNLVQSMLDLHKRLATAKTAHEKTMLERQITATDHQIDQLVHALYGLTADEIKFAEGAVHSDR